MPSGFQRPLHERDERSAARRVAGILALLSGLGTLASLGLWIEVGFVGAALAFAATTAIINLVVVLLVSRMVPRTRRDQPTAAGRQSVENPKRAVSSRR